MKVSEVIKNLSEGKIGLEDEVFTECPQFDEEEKKYVIVRTYSAGVFAGYIESRNGQEVVMRNAIRLYQWAGALCLSDVAQNGVDSKNCKFPCPVDKVELLQAIEILDVTPKAEKTIKDVKAWEK